MHGILVNRQENEITVLELFSQLQIDTKNLHYDHIWQKEKKIEKVRVHVQVINSTEIFWYSRARIIRKFCLIRTTVHFAIDFDMDNSHILLNSHKIFVFIIRIYCTGIIQQQRYCRLFVI